MASCRRPAKSLLSPVLVLSTVILSTAAVLGGCGAEQSVRPISQPVDPDTAAIEVWVQGTLVARFDRPQSVDALLAALPERERASIAVGGQCVPRDPAFRRTLRELLAGDAAAGKGGFSGHIRDATWGEIKIVMAGRRG